MDLTLLKTLIITKKMDQTFIMKDDLTCITNFLIFKTHYIQHKHNWHDQLEYHLKYLESRIEFLYRYYFLSNCTLYTNVRPDQLIIGNDIMNKYINLVDNQKKFNQNNIEYIKNDNLQVN